MLHYYNLKDFNHLAQIRKFIKAKGSKVDNTDNKFSKFSQKPTYVVTNKNDQITKHIQNYTARENTEEKRTVS